jgi:hypothetical protein
MWGPLVHRPTNISTSVLRFTHHHSAKVYLRFWTNSPSTLPHLLQPVSGLYHLDKSSSRFTIAFDGEPQGGVKGATPTRGTTGRPNGMVGTVRASAWQTSPLCVGGVGIITPAVGFLRKRGDDRRGVTVDAVSLLSPLLRRRRSRVPLATITSVRAIAVYVHLQRPLTLGHSLCRSSVAASKLRSPLGAGGGRDEAGWLLM